MALTEFQSDVLEIIKTHSKKGLIGKATCSLKNKEIMREMDIKPNSDIYISRILNTLKDKKLITTEIKQFDGGRRRLITIL